MDLVTPVALMDWIEAITLVIIIIDFVVVYRIFADMTNQIIGFIIAAIILYLLVIPYNWVAWLVFIGGFAYSFFWGFNPWEW